MIYNETEGVLPKPTIDDSFSHLVQTNDFQVRSVTEFIADKKPERIDNNAILIPSTYYHGGKKHIVYPKKTTLSYYAKPHLITRDGKTYKVPGGIKTQAYSYQENTPNTHKTLEFMSQVDQKVTYPSNTFWIG